MQKRKHARSILSQQSTALLQDALSQSTPIRHRDNGNRAIDGPTFLAHLETILPLLGITRVAEISQLTGASFPVYQSTRPGLFYHASMGQNSGSQGKGQTHVQAKISCIMEAVESFCREPHNPNLVRGSFDFLKQQHCIVDPGMLTVSVNAETPGNADPVMWTPALSLELGRDCLVPAEAIYFPFVPKHYDTRPGFPCNSIGAGSGTGYLDATIHALYEGIEHLYCARMEEEALSIEALWEDEIRCFDLANFHKETENSFELRLFVLKLPQVKNLPMVMCQLVSDTASYRGLGCSTNLDLSLTRAISEAIQSWATIVSSSRDDLDPRTAVKGAKLLGLPRFRSLHLADYRRQVVDKTFTTLRQEFDFVVRWLHGLGYHNIFVANLARVGIDLPVVKVLIAGMPLMKENRRAYTGTMADIVARQYSL